MIEFFILVGSIFIQPVSAEVSGNYFTVEPRAERLCRDHFGVKNTGPEFIVCKDNKVFKFRN